MPDKNWQSSCGLLNVLTSTDSYAKSMAATVAKRKGSCPRKVMTTTEHKAMAAPSPAACCPVVKAK